MGIVSNKGVILWYNFDLRIGRIEYLDSGTQTGFIASQLITVDQNIEENQIVNIVIDKNNLDIISISPIL